MKNWQQALQQETLSPAGLHRKDGFLYVNSESFDPAIDFVL